MIIFAEFLKKKNEVYGIYFHNLKYKRSLTLAQSVTLHRMSKL